MAKRKVRYAYLAIDKKTGFIDEILDNIKQLAKFLKVCEDTARKYSKAKKFDTSQLPKRHQMNCTKHVIHITNTHWIERVNA